MYSGGYNTYAHPRRRKLDSRGISRTGQSEQNDQADVFPVKFLGSQLMGKDEPEPELVLDLIASLVNNLQDVHFRPRSYTVQVTDSEVVICETAADWTERVPLRVVHYCLQGEEPYSSAFGFVASARQGFMGHVFLTRNAVEAKELKRSFFNGFERAYRKFKARQENNEPRPRQPEIQRVPFVERPYAAPQYNAYYRYYPSQPYQQPQGRVPQHYAAALPPPERRYATNQQYATRYYSKPEQDPYQQYRRNRPNDSFLHEYQYSSDPYRLEVEERRPRTAGEGFYRTADRRGRRVMRTASPQPPPRESRRRHVVNDDMIY